MGSPLGMRSAKSDETIHDNGFLKHLVGLLESKNF